MRDLADLDISAGTRVLVRADLNVPIKVTDTGREITYSTYGAGEYIGEMSLIDNEPHSATVRAEVQTDMLILGRADFARCLPENTSMAYAVMRGLVQRLRSADGKIESLALQGV